MTPDDTMTICRECCTLLDGPEAGSRVRWTTCAKCASAPLGEGGEDAIGTAIRGLRKIEALAYENVARHNINETLARIREAAQRIEIILAARARQPAAATEDRTDG